MTEVEKKEIVDAVLAEIRKREKPLNGLPVAESLDGLKSLPAFKDDKLVVAKIEQLKGRDGKDGRLSVVDHGTGDTTFALTPNVMHVWGEVASLNLTIAPNTEPDVLAVYSFQFTSPAGTATALTVTGVKWYNDYTPPVEAGKTYQGSVANNVIVMGGVTR